MLSSCGRLTHTQDGAATEGRAIGGSIGDLLVDMRSKNYMSRALATFTWTLAVPFFVLWTFLGTTWLWQVMQETPDCLGSTYAWFSVVWLLLCYYWIVVHVALSFWACRLRRRVLSREANLRGVEDDETLRRWGPVSQNSSG